MTTEDSLAHFPLKLTQMSRFSFYPNPISQHVRNPIAM